MKEGAVLGENPAPALVKLDEPKRLRMDMLRGFSCEKLINAFTEVIDENFEDQSPFQADLDTFIAYFDNDAEEGDVLIFDY